MDLKEWREISRDYLKRGVPPRSAFLEQSLINPLEEVTYRPLVSPTMPKNFLEIAESIAASNDPDKWSLLYRLIYRLNHEEPNLLKIAVDPDVRRSEVLVKSVRKDIHKMHAFVRFKKTEILNVETYVAWHEPEHPCLRLAVPFFVRRFGDKPFSIFTPTESAHWNKEKLSFGEGMPQFLFKSSDPFDEVWISYYKSIYNPARLKIKAMKKEMAPKYWHSMPESKVIHELIRETPKRLQNMAAQEKFLATPPKTENWRTLKEAAVKCQACPLHKEATQTVFGEGSLKAKLMIVGEQPGDEEDLLGRAFVGPAGQIVREALATLGISRDEIYITNAVKHFKWERGENKARVHKKASGTEMQACKPWLEAEIARVKPQVILALGTTAGTALYGRLVKIHEERGKVYTESAFAPQLMISWHPAAILRAANEAEASKRKNELLADLKAAWDGA